MSFNLPIAIASDKATHIVVYHQDPPTSVDSTVISELRREVFNLTKEINALSKRVLHIELAEEEKAKAALPRKSPFFAPVVAPEPSGLEVRRLSEAVPVDTSDSKTLFANLVKVLPTKEDGVIPAITKTMEVAEDVPEPEVELEAQEAEAEQEEVEVEVDQEENEEQEEADEEEEEAEGVAMEEFEYKGVTYYRDAENQVYQLDEDGDLDDTPIGVWNEVKQKVIKYAKA